MCNPTNKIQSTTREVTDKGSAAFFFPAKKEQKEKNGDVPCNDDHKIDRPPHQKVTFRHSSIHIVHLYSALCRASGADGCEDLKDWNLPGGGGGG